MPFNREPIFHDRHCIVDQTDQFTSSATFSDITNATFTTGDLGSPINYLVNFTVLISASSANTTVTFRVLANGSAVSTDRILFIKTSNQDLGFTIVSCPEDLDAGVDLQLQWATDKGTVTLSEFGLVADGIPSIRVI